MPRQQARRLLAHRPAPQRRSGCGTDRSRGCCGPVGRIAGVRSRSPPGAGRMKPAVERADHAPGSRAPGPAAGRSRRASGRDRSTHRRPVVPPCRAAASGGRPSTRAATASRSGRAPPEASAIASSMSIALFRRWRLADDMQAVRDQRVFELEDGGAERADARLGLPVPRRLGLGQIERRRLGLDQVHELRALVAGAGGQPAPALDRGLEIDQPAIEPGMGDRRRQVADQRRRRPAAWRSCPRTGCWRHRDRCWADRRSAGRASTRRRGRPACRA